MELNKSDIQHIAELARLELTEEEIEKYSGQLSAVLDYVGQLQEVDVTGVEPTSQVTGLDNILRNDEIENWDESEREFALSQAPEKEDRQVKVKRVLE